MNGFETVIFEKKGAVAYITLNRPKMLNAYNIKMRDEIYSLLEAIRDDDEVRVTVFKSASEKAFCAGADLTEFLSAPPPVFARKARFERDIWGLFLSIMKPFIAAVHGYVLGSGTEISLCCDIRIAAEDAQFGLPEVGLGILPAAGGSQTLPRVAGRAAAMDMLINGRWLKANEALHCGLVNRVVTRQSLFSEAEALANKIACYKPETVSAIKRAVTGGLDLTLEQGLALERRVAGGLN